MANNIIDVWAQRPMQQFQEGVPEVEPLLVQSSSPVKEWLKNTKNGRVSADFIINQMDEAGIDKIMLCAWNRPNKTIISNDDILEYVEKYPKRIYGVCSVDLTNPMLAVQTIDKYV